MPTTFDADELLAQVDGDWDFLADTVEMLGEDGARLAAVYRAGEVVSRELTPEGVVLTVRVEGWRAEQLGATDGAA